MLNVLDPNRITISGGGCMKWLPIETIVFNGAQARNNTQVYLDNSTQFVGWEAGCLGLPASNTAFEKGASLA